MVLTPASFIAKGCRTAADHPMISSLPWLTLPSSEPESCMLCIKLHNTAVPPLSHILYSCVHLPSTAEQLFAYWQFERLTLPCHLEESITSVE